VADALFAERSGGGSEPDARDCRGFALSRPAILVVGSEARGLRPVVRRACQARALVVRLGVWKGRGCCFVLGVPCSAAAQRLAVVPSRVSRTGFVLSLVLCCCKCMHCQFRAIRILYAVYARHFQSG